MFNWVDNSLSARYIEVCKLGETEAVMILPLGPGHAEGLLPLARCGCKILVAEADGADEV